MAAVTVYRIGRETRKYKAEDLSGAGAAATGGRWNDLHVPMVYASTTRALACLETLVHIAEPSPLPLDRYLIEIMLPAESWQRRTVYDLEGHEGWDALPESVTAIRWGSQWAQSKRSLVATVPSIVVPEECNVLLNPEHADFASITHRIARKWTYDPRLGSNR